MTDPAGEDLTREDPAVLREYYRQMALIRAFELRAAEMYTRARIGGYCHLNLGEEATVVGLTAALRDEDYLFATYREHGYALARGADPGRVMAELFGRDRRAVAGPGRVDAPVRPARSGCWAGTGSSAARSRWPPARRSRSPTAAGPAPDAPAVMCLLGDATTNIGAFHESLNLAALWHLPVVYVIVNNQLGMGTPVEAASAEPELWKRGCSYRMPGQRVDGNDVLAVRDAARAALERARGEHQPALLETVSYRLRGHSVVDPARYRTAEDTERLRREDPLPAFRTHLVAGGVLDEETAAEIDAEADKAVDRRRGLRRRQPRPRRHHPLRPRVRHPGAPACTAGCPVTRVPSRAVRGTAGMTVISYRQALHDTLRAELQRDENVFLIGEEIGVFEGSYKITAGLLAEFGPRRVRDTPICEEGFTGVAIGAAMMGLRPVVEIMTINFSLLAIDQIVNNAAKLRSLSGGQVSVPLVIRTPGGGGQQLSATHSQNLEVWYAHVPGLKVVAPATPADAKGLLTAAIRDDDPVLVLENLALYNTKGEVPDGEHVAEIGRAAVLKPGRDITVIGYSRAAVIALDVARRLEDDGISAEVIDLRSLRPLDRETVCASVRKTSRAVIVEDDWLSYGIGAEIAATIAGGRVRLPRRPGPARRRRRGAAAVRQAARAGGPARRRGDHPGHPRDPRGELMPDVLMPRLSDTMEEGVLSQWVKHEGDQVRKGDVLAVIETDKAAMDMEAYDEGVLTRILVEEGASVPIGTPIAVIGEAAAAATAPSPVPAPDQAERAVVPAPAPAPPTAASPAGRLPASPLARKLARERGVDLSTVSGSGPGGRIVRADIENAARERGAAQPVPQPAAPTGPARPAPGSPSAAPLEGVIPSPIPSAGAAGPGGGRRGDPADHGAPPHRAAARRQRPRGPALLPDRRGRRGRPARLPRPGQPAAWRGPQDHRHRPAHPGLRDGAVRPP